MPSMDSDFGYMDALRTPERVWDVRRILAAANFRVYALVNEPLGFLAGGASPSWRGQFFPPPLSQIAWHYLSPSYINHNQLVTIVSSIARDLPELQFDVANLISPLQSFLPQGMARLSALVQAWRTTQHPGGAFTEQYEHRASLVGQSLGDSELRFRVISQAEVGPLSLAYTEGQEDRVVVIAAGVPRSLFLTVLSSLTRLRQNDDFIDQLQAGLRNGHGQRLRYFEEKRKTEATKRQE